MTVACRRPHRPGPVQRHANYIQWFSVAQTHRIHPQPSQCADGNAPLHTVTARARVRSCHTCSTLEEQLLEMEGETAIDGELRALQFG